MRSRDAVVGAALALVAGTAGAGSFGTGEADVLGTRVVFSQDRLSAGGGATLAVVVNLHGHWHVNAAEPADPALIPTRLVLEQAPGIEWSAPVYPEPESREFEFSPGERLLVYAGEFVIRVPITVAEDAVPGPRTVSGYLRYQACDDERCLPPRKAELDAAITVAAAGQAVTALHPELFGAAPARPAEPSPGDAAVPDEPSPGDATASDAPPSAEASSSQAAPPAGDASLAPGAMPSGDAAASHAAPSEETAPAPKAPPAGDTSLAPGAASSGDAAAATVQSSAVADDVQSASFWRQAFARNGLLAYGLIFLAGLALNLTPCVYPVIPITLGYFANQAERREGKTLSLALTYVLGMAVMYSALGVFAALSGKAFGAALQSPWVLVVEAAVVIALAASMFGMFEIQVPAALATRLGASPTGHAGALFMGLTVGVVAAPCLAPAVLGLFLLVAETSSVWMGFSIFFALALGLGFPFLLLGAASGAVTKMPRSGEWMVWVKHLFGFLLVGMAFYFLRPLTGDAVFIYGLIAVAVVAGVFLGFIDRTGTGIARFARLKTAVGILLLATAVAVFVGAQRDVSASEDAHITWLEYQAPQFESALAGASPILVDFTAEWCLPCKELEKFTFSEPAVVAASGRFRTFRADGTRESEAVEELRRRYAVSGYPTVLFIDSQGRERRDLRLVGFVEADDFLARLNSVE